LFKTSRRLNRFYKVLLGSMLFALLSCSEQHGPSASYELARQGINGGALSADGQFSVIGSLLDGGSLWRNKDNERLFNWNHSKDPDDRIIISADIDTNNTRALTADTSSIVLWDIATGQASRFWSSPAEVLDSKLMTGGRYAMLGLADHSAVIFDAVRGGITRTFQHKGRVRSVDVSDDLQLAITGSEDQTAVIWQLSDGERLFTIAHNEDVQMVKLSHDGHYALSAAKYDRVELWDTKTQQSLGVIPLEKEKLKRGLRITAAEFSHDGSELLLGYPDRRVELRNTKSLALLKKWTLPKRKQWQPTSATVIGLAFDKLEKHYWVMSSDGFLHKVE
jgi:WD40 repeat protein